MHAGAAQSGVDVDENLDRSGRRSSQFGGSVDVVHDDPEVRQAGRQGRGAGGRACPGDGRGDQDRVDAMGRQRLGLGQFGAADADRPGRDLPPGNCRALVRLGVRPQRQAGRLGAGRHQGHIGLEGVEIQHRRRRRDQRARAGLGDQ